MTTTDYFTRLNTRHRTGISRENSYHHDLQILVKVASTDILVTNEPARVACCAPDYIFTRRRIPVGYIEAKDLGEDLENKCYSEHFWPGFQD